MNDLLIWYAALGAVFVCVVAFLAFLTEPTAERAWAATIGAAVLSTVWPLGVCMVAAAILRSSPWADPPAPPPS